MLKSIRFLFILVFSFSMVTNVTSSDKDITSSLKQAQSQTPSSATSSSIYSSASVSSNSSVSSSSNAQNTSSSYSNSNLNNQPTNGETQDNQLLTEVQSNSNAPTILIPAPEEFTSTPYYNSENALGIAGSFHIVGFNTVRLNAHTNGNVLANKLYANSNFGTNNLVDELSYVAHYEQVNSGSATSLSHILAVGSANNVELVDNGNAIAINGTKLDRPKVVWKDDANPFIDLMSLKNQYLNLSTTLSTYSNYNITSYLNTNAGSVDESYIELTNSGEAGIFNTTATEISSLRYLGVKGFSSSNTNGVVINVNCEGVSLLNLPISLISVDGNNIPLSETHIFTNGRVLWNFYNYLPYSATSITASLLHASILAEGASFTASQNLNGTIIANNITINAESHRDDFISEIPTPTTKISVTVNKLWLNSDTSPMDSNGYCAIVQLLQDSTNYGPPITLDESNNFSYTYNDLPSTSTYTIQEQSVLYNSEDVSSLFNITTQNDSNIITVTNTLKHINTVTLPETGGKLYLLLIFGLLITITSLILLICIRSKK